MRSPSASMFAAFLAITVAGCSTASDNSGELTRSASRDDSASTSAAKSGASTPTQFASSDVVPFPDSVTFGPDGGALPNAELQRLSLRDLQGHAWRLLDPAADFAPYFAHSEYFDSLTFDGEQWRVRACGLDMRAAGNAVDFVEISGDWEVFPNPDPGASCMYTPNAAGWAEFLGSRPTINRSGEAMVLHRATGASPWDQDVVVPVPYGLDTVPRETKSGNQRWAQTLYAPGPLEDPAGLPSPQSALDVADAVIAGQVVDSQWTTASNGKDVRVEIEVEVDEIFGGSIGEVKAGQTLVVALEGSGKFREEVRDGPDPAGPVLLALIDGEHGWIPFFDGLWLEGTDGPVNPFVPLSGLAADWRYRGSVQAMSADVRNAAAIGRP